MEILQNIPVEYPANPSVEPMLKRAYIALEDEDWEKAEELFDQILNEAPECALAYLGLSMRTAEINRLEDFFVFLLREDSEDKNLRRAKQFSEGALKARFEEEDSHREEKLALLLAKEERRKEEEAALLALGQKRAAKADGVLFADGDRIIAKKADGTILSSDGAKVEETPKQTMKYVRENTYVVLSYESRGANVKIKLWQNGSAKLYEGYDEDVIDQWTEMAAVALVYHGGWFAYAAGLKTDGTLTYNTRGGSGIFTSGMLDWENIINFAAGDYQVATVDIDGRVRVVGMNGDCKQYDVSNWRDIVSVAVGKEFVAGLKADGTLVVEGKCKGKERVTGWKLFNSIDTLDEERKQHARDDLQKDIDTLSDRLVERAEEEDRIQEELSHLKGLFTGQRRKELEHRLEVIGNDQRFMLRKIEELESKMKKL